MEMQQQQQDYPPPPAYTQHDPDSLHLPSVPTHTPPSVPETDRHLPGIKSLDLPDASSTRPNDHREWAPLPPLVHTFPPHGPASIPRQTPEVDVGSPMDTTSAASPDDRPVQRSSSVLSMDDPDVRLAAEALSGLGNPDFARSPSTRSLTLPRDAPREEPLLSLITSNHPWLGGTITGSLSAYNATKSYSPALFRNGAEYFERNIGSAVVNTVSSVGKRTGVEKNLRRYLGQQHRRPSDLEQGDGPMTHKRRKVAGSAGTDAMDIEDAPSPRRRGGSQSSIAESLPAYDDHRSPKYEETQVVVLEPGKTQQTDIPMSQERRMNWSTQLIVTTSGLGVALSDSSLKSLKLCLGLLRSATKHIDSVMHALKLVLEEYEQALRSREQSAGGEENGVERLSLKDDAEMERQEEVRQIADRMKSLSSDIWRTLQNVVQSVSRYTGGALPQNASAVVRTQLLSVPQRWRVASQSTVEAEAGAREGNEGGIRGEEVRGAKRMLAFAREGMDMMTQISTVVDGTVKSAESWLSSMGRGGNGGGNGDGDGQRELEGGDSKVGEKGGEGDVAFWERGGVGLGEKK